MNTNELIEAFKAHAVKHYEDGFDVFVEAYEDAELVEFFSRTNGTLEEWIKEAESYIGLREEQRMNCAW